MGGANNALYNTSANLTQESLCVCACVCVRACVVGSVVKMSA